MKSVEYTYQCDRCGLTVEQSDSDQPYGWRENVRISIDNCHNVTWHAKVGDLVCRECCLATEKCVEHFVLHKPQAKL